MITRRILTYGLLFAFAGVGYCVAWLLVRGILLPLIRR